MLSRIKLELQRFTSCCLSDDGSLQILAASLCVSFMWIVKKVVVPLYNPQSMGGRFGILSQPRGCGPFLNLRWLRLALGNNSITRRCSFSAAPPPRRYELQIKISCCAQMRRALICYLLVEQGSFCLTPSLYSHSGSHYTCQHLPLGVDSCSVCSPFCTVMSTYHLILD